MQIEQLGPYRIIRQLGRGGMGTVYEGTLIETGEPAAIKILSSTLAHDEGFRERFKSEIETLRKLRHPNIVRLYGFGEEEDHLFYAMELIVGRSLEDDLQAGRRFQWREVTDYAIQTCRALKHAHDRGVVHRDIKPANLLVSGEGQIKLSDFGIAKLFGASGVTAVGGVLGTAEYMAPEQTDGRPITPRCDLYSLGGVMYTLLAGRPPFKAATLVEMLQLQRFAEPDPVRRYAPDVPEELQVIIRDLLVKDPDQRIATAMVLSRRLEAMRHGLLSRVDPLLSAPTQEVQPPVPPVSMSSATITAPGLQIPPLEPATAADQTEISNSYDIESPVDPAAARHERALSATLDLVSVTSPAGKTGRPPRANRALSDSTAANAEKGSSRFVTVSDEEHRRFEATSEDRAHWVSLHTALLLLAVIALGTGTWYLMQPASADHLYERISAACSSGEMTSLQSVEGDMRSFLAHYADDPRAERVRAYAEMLQQQKISRQAEFQVRATYAVDGGTLVRRAYLDAMSYAKLNPELAVQKLGAIIDLYGNDDQLSRDDRETLESARSQWKLFQTQIAHRTEADTRQLLARLDAADRLQNSDPATARAVREAIVRLYSDKPWAAAIVARASADLSSRTAADDHGSAAPRD